MTTGKVYLIGAGPGAADLITVRGMRLLAEADVVLHDALVQPEMLAYCPQAKLIEVGKRCGQRSTAQNFINKQIIDAAIKYPCVVRLKGGDPMLFGRAEEELRALHEAGIETEVVPGITAALAAAASLKRPLTQRGVSRSVAFATQARAEDSAAVNAVAADSMIFYMGRDNAARIASELIAQGRAPETPACIVEALSTAHERRLSLNLAEMAAGLAQNWMNSTHPALLLMGEAFADTAWARSTEKLISHNPEMQYSAIAA
jgi:uroporphyrin-III C-methyltransferase